MIRGLTVSLGLIGLLTACGGADSDGDGISNKEEKELGLDPKVADSDGDGIEDGAEIDAGTNPLEADSDGDGLSDGEEAEHGTDPLNADADEDGLLDGAEIEWGSDPHNPDTDEDGLNDGDEVANGADPTILDTDEDTYIDFHEVVEGTDPADKKDKIYQGKWPYYYGKDDLPQAKVVRQTVQVGELFGRYKAKDHFADKVDLYDFYNTDGKYILLDVSAQWCPPCQDMASWVGGNGSFGGGAWDAIPSAVKSGEIYWITVLSEDFTGQNTTWEEAAEWEEAYPAKKVPVLSDKDGEMVSYSGLNAWPYVILLNPDLTVAYRPGDGPNDGYWDTLDYTLGLLGN